MNEIKTKSPFLSGFLGKDPKLKAVSLSRFALTRESPAKGSFRVRDNGGTYKGGVWGKKRKTKGDNPGFIELSAVCLEQSARAIRKKALRLPLRAFKIWSGWGESNSHSSRNQNLNLARLPISPQPEMLTILSHFTVFYWSLKYRLLTRYWHT